MVRDLAGRGRKVQADLVSRAVRDHKAQGVQVNRAPGRKVQAARVSKAPDHKAPVARVSKVRVVQDNKAQDNKAPAIKVQVVQDNKAQVSKVRVNNSRLNSLATARRFGIGTLRPSGRPHLY